MTRTLPMHELVAFNTATASENKIHDDEVAASLGFGGGLVPGVEVYAYLCRPAIAEWGQTFLARGRATVRFDSPVYDGETVEVRSDLDTDGRLQAAVHSALGQRATLTAWIEDNPAERPAIDEHPLPPDRPPASPESLTVGSTLGTVRANYSREDMAGYLGDIREENSPVLQLGLVHPGRLLHLANSALGQNVVLGPWIHVGSEIQHLQPVEIGEDITVRSTVRSNHEHKGHRFVVLDVVITGQDGSPRCSIVHTAIYEPRQLRPSVG